MKSWVSKNLPVFLWAFLIYLGSSLPAAQVSSDRFVDFLAHKSAHLLEYAILGLLYYRSRLGDLKSFSRKEILQTLLFVTLYGAFDEYHQSFVPGRQSRAADVLTDFLGGLGGLSLWQVWRRRLKPKPKN